MSEGGTWRIVDMNVMPKKVIEATTSPRAACKVLWIFTAHELKNGRTPNYRIEPAVTLMTPEECDLPSWALPILKQHHLSVVATAFQASDHKPKLAAAMADHFREVSKPLP